ncbi:UDP-N-acetylmuramate--L-alanine ligase [Microbacter margulisiae]|uniref:UDP-N-acetylmuramate: L-alanyl-gamma-D-glutamyl-meso-diaminopimelate ligase n=1 Tax=Microbacter margulisiae TaxID=1350067 RepID=A0A7W5H2F9_9PORP|nr:Mur ligase family protein [Microbacter margulisiae]MBB3188628.1 UDP-N-acetylmuramate: L-alanyl-gamma-D-glutamyl-meso-diaminopimelate ligase [Microbacter margulisiae]
MKHLHFIAIGGAAMHNLAIAVSKKQNYIITGSDDEIFEPSKSHLIKAGLLPEKMGWFPEKITKELNAVIVGMHARADNPELLRAKELGLDIYSFPEYLYYQTQKKTRIVVGGSHGKTTTTALILHVLHKRSMPVDYMVGAQLDGFETMVKLSYDAPIAVFEGDEYLSSPLDPRPKFHLYHPHIAVLTGIAWDHINVFPTFEMYVDQFKKFADLIERDGRLIYNGKDPEVQNIATNLRTDIVAIPYDDPEYEISNSITSIIYKGVKYPLQVFGEHNLQNIAAACLVCKQLGVQENDFYAAIQDFKGASNRLQKIAETTDAIAYKDFAHASSKVKATVDAVKRQYPDKELVACLELHTFSSLQAEYLPQYHDCMKNADKAFIYFNPEVIAHKQLPPLSEQSVKEAFGEDNVHVFSDSSLLQSALRSINFQNKVLLFMTSGTFSGINLEIFANELLKR